MTPPGVFFISGVGIVKPRHLLCGGAGKKTEPWGKWRFFFTWGEMEVFLHMGGNGGFSSHGGKMEVFFHMG